MNFIKLTRCFNFPNRIIKRISIPKTSLLTSISYTTKPPSSNIDQNEVWSPFFKFPYIVHARVISRLKLYQSFIAISYAPIAFGCYFNNILMVQELQKSVFIMSLACLMLYIMGNFFRRLIGTMYLNKTGDSLKLSHLSFFGKRLDIIIPLEDVMLLSETGYSRQDVYIKLKRYSTQEYLYYITTLGGIIDKDKFNQVFGPNAADLFRKS